MVIPAVGIFSCGEELARTLVFGPHCVPMQGRPSSRTLPTVVAFAVALTAACAGGASDPSDDPQTAIQPAVGVPAGTSATETTNDAPSVDDEIPIAAYPPPTLTRTTLRGGKTRARIVLAWKRVPGASSYRVQVSRTLTFGSLLVDEEARRSRTTTPWLEPGLFFVRVRAEGAAGTGAFSRAHVPTRQGRPKAMGKPPNLEPDVDAPEVSAEPTPLRLTLRAPGNRSLQRAPSVEIHGEATAGAMVSVAGGEPVEAAPEFVLTTKLSHGINRLEVTAILDSQSETRRRTVYYADPRKTQNELKQLRALSAQLAEVRKLEDDLESTVRALRGQFQRSNPKQAALIEADLADIAEAQKSLRSEVEKAVASLETLLESTR